VRDAVILFAKAPTGGNVKTRLASRMSLAAAADLHRAFVYDMVDALSTLDADLSIATDSPAWTELGIPVLLQRGGDLGERLLNAASGALAEGRRSCAIVGSDAPTLPADHIRALLDMTADVALGPAEDGGFYAIACRRTQPAMFDGVSWSSPETLRETEAALASAGLGVGLGPSWFDIDTPADLDRLSRSEVPAHTRRWMEVNLAAR
jgi:rSAM/selenodomain-associated transferase 1